ncbi:hypothetical protein ABIE67_009458 [Streptomyces sp. V4I8]|uniref:hypothetical protein n=1 Tax=Streptomyces sp. V4I8 TaxID=3156469 RepID=UPI0035163E6E
MPRAIRPTAIPAPRTAGQPGPSLLRLSFTVEIERAVRTHTLVGQAARSLLAAIGAPPPLAQHLGDTATVAAHYLNGHSQHSRYRLWIHTDPAGITLTVTDHLEHPPGGTPAWLPAAHTGRLQQPTPTPDPDPTGPDHNHQLGLHHTPDGHIRLTHHTPWPTPQPGTVKLDGPSGNQEGDPRFSPSNPRLKR